MSYLTIRAHLLRMAGKRRTIAVAEAHNSRRAYSISGQDGRIRYAARGQNLELIPVDDQSLESKVLKVLKTSGIDVAQGRLKNKNRGFAVEFLFSVTSGHRCCFDALYAECLQWLRIYLPECPIVSAIIHYDEDTPHMHVVVVPIKDGRLQADAIRGYVSAAKERNRSVYAYPGGRYGLTYPEKLRGAIKEVGSRLAIEALETVPRDKFMEIVGAEIKLAVCARPEPFLSALGITFERVLDEFRNPFVTSNTTDDTHPNSSDRKGLDRLKPNIKEANLREEDVRLFMG